MKWLTEKILAWNVTMLSLTKNPCPQNLPLAVFKSTFFKLKWMIL